MPPSRSTSLPASQRRHRPRLVLAATVAVMALFTAGTATVLGTVLGGGGASAAPVMWGTGQDGVAPFGDATLGTGPAAGAGTVAALVAAPGGGYWLARADGHVTPEGAAHDYGSLTQPHAPVAGMAPAPDGHGYWVAAADGGVFAFGDAPFLGAAAGRGMAAPIVAMASTPSGRGYWLAGADGGVFAFGDARFLGAAAGHGLVAPIVGMAATPSGRGYWLAGADGGVFAFGDATYLGSRAAQPLAASITGIATTPSGHGYWLTGADGGVFTYGDAPYLGSVRTDPGLAPTTAIAGTADGGGYWQVLSPREKLPLGTFLATCYTGGVTTATGTPPSSQVIAVDPGVIPLGSRVFIPGIGVRTAADTGGGIRGARVDVWEPSLAQCVQFGVQPVSVFLLR